MIVQRWLSCAPSGQPGFSHLIGNPRKEDSKGENEKGDNEKEGRFIY